MATSSLGSWADPVTQDSESMCKDLGRPSGSREMALQAPGILLSPELGGGGVGGGRRLVLLHSFGGITRELQ